MDCSQKRPTIATRLTRKLNEPLSLSGLKQKILETLASTPCYAPISSIRYWLMPDKSCIVYCNDGPGKITWVSLPSLPNPTVRGTNLKVRSL